MSRHPGARGRGQHRRGEARGTGHTGPAALGSEESKSSPELDTGDLGDWGVCPPQQMPRARLGVRGAVHLLSESLFSTPDSENPGKEAPGKQGGVPKGLRGALSQGAGQRVSLHCVCWSGLGPHLAVRGLPVLSGVSRTGPPLSCCVITPAPTLSVCFVWLGATPSRARLTPGSVLSGIVLLLHE